MTTVTPIEAALEVECADDVAWSDAADVVIVGWGAAGACAAIEARDAGASVLVFDRFAGGGASALSGGVGYAGGGTWETEPRTPLTSHCIEYRSGSTFRRLPAGTISLAAPVRTSSVASG